MGNKIVAYQENGETKFVKEFDFSFDEKTKTKDLVLTETEVMVEGKLFTKYPKLLMDTMIGLGLTPLVLKPFETSNYYSVRVVFITPSDFHYNDDYDNTFGFKLVIDNNTLTKNSIGLEFTNVDDIVIFGEDIKSLKELVKQQWNFKNKKDALEFIETHKYALEGFLISQFKLIE